MKFRHVTRCTVFIRWPRLTSQQNSVVSNMMNFVSLFGLMASSFLVVRGYEKMLGPGKWSVINVMKCDEDATMLLKFEVNRRKINRTHDGFNANMKLDEAIDETYAVRIDICKYVDGGCKPYQVMADDSLANFVKKYAASNVEKLFTLAKIDPPDFPVSAGDYALESFVFNYEELPEDCPYGEYGCKAFIVKDGLEKGCLYVHTRCDEIEEER